MDLLNYFLHNELTSYLVLESLTFEFNVGFLLGCSFLIQIITGFFLACMFVSESSLAFDSIQFLTRNISYCWYFRFLHINGASILFVLLYLHLFKNMANLTYKFPRDIVWIFGCMIFIISFLIGFTGYSLVWGQMSYWALTVITNLVTSVPIVGFEILDWIWGNTVLTSFSLRRFFCIHFLSLD